MWTEETRRTLQHFSALRQELEERFTHRDEVIDTLALAAVCQEHVLLLGPPGTGKTEVVSRFAAELSMPTFHYLLTRFTEPAELFGPLDLPAFKEGRYHLRTEGMLPEARIAFLDEVFQGSSAILNTLLTLVHERVFHNGAAHQKVPLITLVGASNDLPEDPTLRAFSDRFVLRLQVDPVPEEKRDDLLDRGWMLERERLEASFEGGVIETGGMLTEERLRPLHRLLLSVRLDAIRPTYGAVVSRLKAAGVELSDRRLVKGLKLVAGAALLAGRDEAAPADLWPLRHMWARAADAGPVRELVDGETDGATVRDALRRTTDEIVDDLNRLASQVAALRSETAVAAHLMSLNRLRREVLSGYPGERALLGRIEEAIGTIIGRLEGRGV